MSSARTWKLLGADGNLFASPRPGTLGGNRRTRVYGRLDCRTALAAIRRGGYVANRVFFVDETTAVAARYRPCAVCLRNEYNQRSAASGPAQQLRLPLLTAQRAFDPWLAQFAPKAGFRSVQPNTAIRLVPNGLRRLF